MEDVLEKCEGPLGIASAAVGVVIFCVCLCCCFVVVLVLALIIDSIQYVNYDEYGVDHNIYTKAVGSTVWGPGRHFMGVGHRFIKFPRVYRTIEFSNLSRSFGGILVSRTSDGLPISLEISFQYRLKQEDILDLFNSFATEYEDVYVKIARDVLRDVASRHNATQFFDDRQKIGVTMKTELAARLAEVKATVDFLQLRGVNLPATYETTIEAKEIVRQDILKAEFEREQQRVMADTEVMVAQRKAQTKIIDAEATAKSILLQAEAQANGTRLRVQAESEAYGELIQKLSFNSTDLLSYLWIQAVKDHYTSKLIVNLDKPAVLRVGN